MTGCLVIVHTGLGGMSWTEYLQGSAALAMSPALPSLIWATVNNTDAPVDRGKETGGGGEGEVEVPVIAAVETLCLFTCQSQSAASTLASC